jgi:hypothetical protein
MTGNSHSLAQIVASTRQRRTRPCTDRLDRTLARAADGFIATDQSPAPSDSNQASGTAATPWGGSVARKPFSTRKLHKRLHTHRTCDEEQVLLNGKA